MDAEEKSGSDSSAPAWMATFADMMSLLLTFFVLLLSFATMDVVKFRDAMGSIQEALGFLPTGTGVFQQSSSPAVFEKPLATSTTAKSVMNDVIEGELKEIVSGYGLQKDVDVEKSKRGVILRVKGKIFFNAGEAKLKRDSYPILEKIVGILKRFPRKVSIEGHTDNIPVSGGRYASNWELSTERAISALRFFKERGDIDLKRINIAGFADTHPIAPNDTPEGRASNRRVEFVFYKE
ncbi:motility protein B [bacterium BMS3Bbin06]|nr:motility protein B [bacterium BMS3Bbin06]HDH00659.1 flagellar motor protein MotB [Nitrospirota bacterium]HDO36210.1 flagellar motor protein MotB [Nitrospirota bacterium]HDY70977.1 flagellar motor protein MotB [Nitrospirota bacterium]